MKTKRTLFSMIVFLSVFCLSVALDIKVPYHLLKSTHSNDEDISVAVTDALPNEVEEASIIPFSYRTTAVNSWDAMPYYAEAGSGADNAVISEEILTGTNETEQKPDVLTKDQIQSNDSKENSKETEPKDKPKSKYSDIGISIAASYVNIREKASTGSDVLGKLYRDAAAKILKTKGDWYYVESGSVKGYVKSEFIKTGISDDVLIDKYGILSISVKVDGLNVREKPDTEADKLTVIYENEKYPVVDLKKDWVKVDITDDKVIGYVKREFADLIVEFKKAISKEEELELLKIQEEERIKKETEVKYRDGVSYTQQDLKLLACLVQSEAGTQSYEGKLAVANIVLNRVKSIKYADTIKAVIYQPGQFSVAASRSLAKQLAIYDHYSTNSQLLSIKAAKAALEGANNIGTRLYFHSYNAAVRKGYESKPDSVRLDGHLFW